MRKHLMLIVIFCAIIQHTEGIVSPLKRPRAGDPFDTYPKNFWQEFSSPFTEIPEQSDHDEMETTTHEPFPFFADLYTTLNMSIQLYSHAYLHCRVNDLQGKTVSWMRRNGDELALITFGRHTYSSDSRYSLEFEEPNDWKLCIQYTNEKDEGPYECQVSSHPPLILVIYLHVNVPHIQILDERGTSTPEKYYKAGSTIELLCIISQIPQPTNYITWKHGSKLLNYDTSRGGISVKTDLLQKQISSRLYIANANQFDSGNYTCMLNNDISVAVTVHVINSKDNFSFLQYSPVGEQPAAMQHSGNQPIRIVKIHVVITLSFWLNKR